MSMNTFSLQSINQQNQSLSSFFFPLDHNPPFQEFDISFERGPRYKTYADLRESKLKLKSKLTQQTHQENYDFEPHTSILTPKKEVKFQKNLATLPKRSKGLASLAQSVPDFSAMMRKENRKPSSPLPPVVEKNATPPLSGSKSGRKVGGSKSVNAGEKKGGSMMCRKSYASVEELKGLASIARSGIIGENNNIINNNKVGVTTRASSRNVLRYSRQF